jgi:hypothetical protein
VLQRLQNENGECWATVREIRVEERTKQMKPAQTRNGAPPSSSELVCAPSQPLCFNLHDCCYTDRLHPPRATPFVPDPSFYHTENCEGLWVCVSKSCGEATLRRACDFVRSMVPETQRSLWAKFRSPKWAKDPGPMRLVVLNNISNERAGMIPELKDGSGGRNGTSCPFVFTSKEDVFQGIGGKWIPCRLTAHEMTHGCDMVIRQLLDPAFEEIAQSLFVKYRELCCYSSPNGAMKATYVCGRKPR